MNASRGLVAEGIYCSSWRLQKTSKNLQFPAQQKGSKSAQKVSTAQVQPERLPAQRVGGWKSPGGMT